MTNEDRDTIYRMIDETYTEHGDATTFLKVLERMEALVPDLLDRYDGDRGEFASVFDPYFSEKTGRNWSAGC